MSIIQHLPVQAQSCAELVEATATAKGRVRTALRIDNATLCA